MNQRMTTLFKNGSSQAVRLPKEFRFKKDKIYIYQEGDKIILSAGPRSWRDFFEKTPLVSKDFMSDRLDAAPQEREKIE
jgi:antitoxin VapB